MLYGYDKGADGRLRELQDTYPDAIPVLGGAVFATTAVKAGDMDAFVEYLLNAITASSHMVKNWQGGTVSICESFCHVCLVDPKLAEAYLGRSFADIAALL